MRDDLLRKEYICKKASDGTKCSYASLCPIRNRDNVSIIDLKNFIVSFQGENILNAQ